VSHSTSGPQPDVQPDRTIASPSLRRRLREGGGLRGVFCELPGPESVEIAGLAGWDFVVLDCEHAPITAAQVPDLVRAAGTVGLPAIVRVSSADPPGIQHALDSGAAGVQIPQIASAGAAAAAVRASRFHPLGMRGFNPFVRAAGFSARPVAAFLAHANEETTVVLQVESAEGLAAIDSILEVAGFDVLFIGPYDLSQSLGIPGQTSDERVFAEGARIVRKAGDAGRAAGVFTNSAAEARRWRELGVRYLCYSVDTVILLNGMRAALDSL
jgi:4-hydroxy-2-oxoheptanedioate aldolase